MIVVTAGASRYENVVFAVYRFRDTNDEVRVVCYNVIKRTYSSGINLEYL